MRKILKISRFNTQHNTRSMSSFDHDEKHAFLRRAILISVFLSFWCILAFTVHPLIGISDDDWLFRVFPPSSNPFLFLLQKAASACLSFDVLAFILLIIYCWFFGLNLISVILAKWFEIRHIKDARNFLTTTAFGRIFLPKIQIKNGEMLITQGKPWLLKLGGPAEYTILPGNIMLTRKKSSINVIINGCLSRTNKTGMLYPFERIINAYKIQDIEVEIECKATTKDWVPCNYQHGQIKLEWMDNLTETEQLHLIKDWLGNIKLIPNTISNLTQSVVQDAIITAIANLNSEIIKGKGDLSQLNTSEIAQLLKICLLRREHLFHTWRKAWHIVQNIPLNINKNVPRFLGRSQIWVYPHGTRYLKQAKKLTAKLWDMKQFNDTIIETVNSTHPFKLLCSFTWKQTGIIQLNNE